VIFIGLGGWPGLAEPGLAVPALPPYTSTSVLDLVLGVVVGVVTAVLIAAVRRGARTLAAEGGARIPMPVLLIGGGLAVGLLAQLAGWLGADSQSVLFSGQDGVPGLVGETSTSIVAILLVTKALAYGISLGAGFRGGPVFPAIFLGIAVAMFPVIWFGVSPTLAVAIGAAAGVVVVTRLLVTAVLFAALLTGTAGFDTVSAAVLASASAWIAINALDRLARPAEPTEAIDGPAEEGAESPDVVDRPADGAQERPATA
jgi:H+/Cl- antiporter ClcA